MVLDAPRGAAKVIEAQTVDRRIDQIQQPRPEGGPLPWVHLTFEYRQLNAGAEILTSACHAPQPAPPFAGHGADIVTDEHEHGDQREMKGG